MILIIPPQTIALVINKDEYYERRIVNISNRKYEVTESQKDGTLNVWVKEIPELKY